MENQFEIKIRHSGDKRAWEQIWTVHIGNVQNEQFIHYVTNALAKQPDVVEVRWNRKGSLQGHYIRGCSNREYDAWLTAVDQGLNEVGCDTSVWDAIEAGWDWYTSYAVHPKDPMVGLEAVLNSEYVEVSRGY